MTARPSAMQLQSAPALFQPRPPISPADAKNFHPRVISSRASQPSLTPLAARKNDATVAVAGRARRPENIQFFSIKESAIRSATMETEVIAEGEEAGGQKHDRFNKNNHTQIEVQEAGLHISVFQKMISATAGSLLTSLLGAHIVSTSLYVANGSSYTFGCRTSPFTISIPYSNSFLHCDSNKSHSILAQYPIRQSSTRSRNLNMLSGGVLGEQ